MIELHEIPITVKIHLEHSDYNDTNGWPLVQIDWNDTVVGRYEANCDVIEFKIVQDVTRETSVLRFHHYGKNYIAEDKWVEVKKMYINNIDLQHVTWDSVQHAFIPPWDNESSGVLHSNLYLGHNGYVEWQFKNPLLLDIQKRLGKHVEQIHGQETTREVLEKVKEYFWNQ